MDKSDLVTLLVAVLAALSALASQRQSAKATRGTNQTAIVNARTEAETEAYVRARAMDLDTIERLADELKAARTEMGELRERCEVLERKADALQGDNDRLRVRIIELEKH